MRQKLIKLCLVCAMTLSLVNLSFVEGVKALSGYDNIALNKTVTADSTASGKSVNYLVDGAVVDKQTWQVAYVAGSAYDRGNGNTEVQLNLDLDARCIINEIDLTWATTVWAKTIKIEGSVDGNEYFLIKEITDNVISADKERQIIAIEDKEVQYLRFTFNDPNNKTYGYELYDIEVYGAELVND